MSNMIIDLAPLNLEDAADILKRPYMIDLFYQRQGHKHWTKDQLKIIDTLFKSGLITYKGIAILFNTTKCCIRRTIENHKMREVNEKDDLQEETK